PRRATTIFTRRTRPLRGATQTAPASRKRDDRLQRDGSVRGSTIRCGDLCARKLMRHDLRGRDDAAGDEVERIARVVRAARVARDEADLAEVEVVRLHAQTILGAARGEEDDARAAAGEREAELHRRDAAGTDDHSVGERAVSEGA